MLQRTLLIGPDACLPLQQHPAFAQALRKISTDAQIDTFGDAAQAVVLRRRLGPLGTLKFASRGPVWARHQNKVAQADLLRETGLHVINADGIAHEVLRAAGYRRIITGAHVAELPVQDDPATQLGLANAKFRYSVRRAAKARLNINVAQFCPLRHAWLLSADISQQRAKGFRALPHGVVSAFASIQPGDALVITARSHNEDIAAMLFLRHGPVATYHIGWTTPEGRTHCAHHQLLMHAAANLDVRRIDLGTVDTESAPGLARFKISTGATIRALGGTWLRMPTLARRIGI